jgi:hypothetical protein
MKTSVYVSIVALVMLVACTGFAMADRLPNQTVENQVFSLVSAVEATGTVVEAGSMQWKLASPRAITTSILGAGATQGTQTWSDSTTTNGGYLKETKSFAFDSQNKALDLYNIETSKVLTYAADATTGSVLAASESLTLDVMGNWTWMADSMPCIFASLANPTIPAFCNVVSAKSQITGATTLSATTAGKLRAVAADSSIPAGLTYTIDVGPDASTGSSYAKATVGTEFMVSITEGRSTAQNYNAMLPDGSFAGGVAWGITPGVTNGMIQNGAAATNSYSDKATVAGMITKFNKNFNYKSGIRV